MKRLTHLSLFSGIGGIDLAAHWAGFETVAFVERDEFCQKVLRKNFPGVEIHGDIREFNGGAYKGATLVSGGFPCQPFSVAGSRKGTDDPRFLWDETLRVVREVEPEWFLGENVAGLLTIDDGRTFGTILHDLAESGFSVGYAVYGACDAGAAHRRERVFIVAHANRSGGDFSEEDGRRGGRVPDIDRQTEAENAKRNLSIVQSWEVGRNGLAEREGEPRDWRRLGIKPALCGGSDGIPNWVDRLKSLGNAVVPQQVYPILQSIADLELGR